MSSSVLESDASASSRGGLFSDRPQDHVAATVAGPIALFVPSFAGGGAERVMVNLARGLRDLGRDTDLVVATATGPYRDAVPAGVGVVDLGNPRVAFVLPGLVRYLRRRRPAVLITALEHANVIALLACRLARVPTRVIVTIHDTLSQQAATETGFRRRVVRVLMRRLYRTAAAIVAVSQGAAVDAERFVGLPEGSVGVLPNPVLTPEVAARAAEPLDDPWLAPGAPPVILGCGRLVPQKDFALLLRAFAAIAERTTARLVILGEGPDRPALEALAASLGIADRVALRGFVANPFAWMARSALFVLSSQREGSPTVLVEALACGCRVVSTDCPSGPRELLAQSGAGTLVPVGDAVALSRAMLESLEAPRGAAPDLAAFDHLTAARRYLQLAGSPAPAQARPTTQGGIRRRTAGMHGIGPRPAGARGSARSAAGLRTDGRAA